MFTRLPKLDERTEASVIQDPKYASVTQYPKHERFAHKVAGFLNEDVDTIFIGGTTLEDKFIRIYGHMEEAHIAITHRWSHMANASIEYLMDDLMYARLVALCIRTSSLLSDKRYSMDKTYLRLNFEKRRVLNYWRHKQIPFKQTIGSVLNGPSITAGFESIRQKNQ